MAILCGIDEAGRGAVIGPLVLAGVAIEEADNNKLRYIKVKDSKQLTKKQREKLFDNILSISKAYKIAVIDNIEIDNAVNRNYNLNLNWLEARYSAQIINQLNPNRVMIDCPSSNLSAYRNYIKRYINDKGVELYIEHKADLNHPVVSAASIIAKVIRDNEIEKLKKILNVDFGSGYPSDPITIAFLEKNFSNYSNIFRQSWSTFRNAKEKKLQKRLFEFQSS